LNSSRSLGFGPAFLAQLSPEQLDDPPIGRVRFSARGHVQLDTSRGVVGAILEGPLRDGTAPTVVGDWVIVRFDHDPPLVTRRLERTSTFRRRDPHEGVQVVAANIDVAVVCAPADTAFNLRRLERWLLVAGEAGAEPAVVLTKCDLHPDPKALVAEVAALSPGLRVVATSAVDGTGRDELLALFEPGRTIALLGTSGVGKSTLVNWVLGDDTQDTGPVREHDGRGRHTTTARHLFRLENGAWLLDNPGIRQIGPTGDVDLGDAFPEIEAAAERCRFRDCAHDGEPGCAVGDGIADGTIDEGRLASWQKLQRELAWHARREDPRALATERRGWKRRSKEARARGMARREFGVDG
jgi:ribosome biogenesis GTPase